MPWEDAGEYHGLLASLVAEHAPEGPTEEHLVEEIAGILWRKRRLRLAEAAAHHQGLRSALLPFHDTAEAAVAHLDTKVEQKHLSTAVKATEADTMEQLADLESDESMTRRALEMLGSKSRDPYKSALAAIRDDTRAWWEDHLESDPDEIEQGESETANNAEGLREFLEGDVMSWYANRRKELALRPLIRDQALGEAVDPNRLERLARYEVHLDRKLERMLTMLIRLRDLRGEGVDS